LFERDLLFKFIFKCTNIYHVILFGLHFKIKFYLSLNFKKILFKKFKNIQLRTHKFKFNFC